MSISAHLQHLIAVAGKRQSEVCSLYGAAQLTALAGGDLHSLQIAFSAYQIAHTHTAYLLSVSHSSGQ